MNDPEKSVDTSAATVNVAPDTGAAEAAPAAATTAEPASAPTEAPNGGEAPANQPPAEEPEWFKQRIKQITRQRRESERRADRLAAELESIKRTQVPPQPKSAELRAQDFPSYDAFVAAVAKQSAKEAAGEVIEANNRSRSDQEVNRAVQGLQGTFLEKMHEQAEGAGIEPDEVLETLAQDHLPFTAPVMALVTESEHTARLAAYLAENPDELRKLSQLGPALAKKFVAKVEASFSTPAPKPNATNAPPPVPPVGGRAVTTVDPSKLNMEDYAKYWEKRQEKLHG
jgi:hypothetical protein